MNLHVKRLALILLCTGLLLPGLTSAQTVKSLPTAVLPKDDPGVSRSTTQQGVVEARTAGTGLSTARAFDGLPSHLFRVEIEGVTQADFLSVSGVSCSTEVREVRAGADSTTRLVPGASSCGPITLKRTVTLDESRALWDWYKNVQDGSALRKAGSIIFLDLAMREVMRYNFFEAWPASYTLGPLDSTERGALTEEVVIAVEQIVRG